MNNFHLKDDWRYEVANGDTVLGFKEWCEHKDESNRSDKEENWPGEHKGISAMAGNNYVTAEESQKMNDDINAGLIHDEENDYTLRDGVQSCWITVDDYSVYVRRMEDGVAAEIYGRGREDDAPLESNTILPPFDHNDGIAYLEVARMFMRTDAEAIKSRLDITDEEFDRLRAQLNDYMCEDTPNA